MYSLPDQPLSLRDRLLSLRAGLMIPVVEIMLRRQGFQRSQRMLGILARRLPFKRQAPEGIDSAQWIASLVDLGNRRYSIYPADCLTRSLVLYYQLARHRTDAEICLGVRTIMGRFEAHAWVEVDGIPLNELETVGNLYTKFDWTSTKPTGRSR